MITLLYYTASRIPEKFGENVRQHLLETSKGKPIVSVSQKPLKFGDNICVGEIGYSAVNVYQQILVGLRAIKTKYVVLCEDDTIHSSEHFDLMPDDDTVLYNWRWNVMPTYFYFRRHRNGLCTCIVPREFMLALAEKKLEAYEITKNPLAFAEPGRRERNVGLPPVKVMGVSTEVPSLTFRHPISLSGIGRSLNSDRKAESLPFWGKASEVWSKFYE